MRRLKTALLVAVVLLGGASIAVLGGGTLVLRTRWGNEWVRQRIESEIQSALGTRGRVVVGRLGLAPLGTLSLDTLELRDAAEEVVFASGPIRARFEMAPLLDGVLHLRHITLQRLQTELSQDRQGRWNVVALFSGDTSEVVSAPAAGTPWRVSIDSLELAGGRVRLTRPAVSPDSAPVRTRFDGMDLVLGPSHFSLASREGELAVRHLAVAIDRPPLPIRHTEGRLLLFRDSLQLDLPLLRLASSRAAVAGTVGWGGASTAGNDAMLALTLRADSVAFRDIAWITPLIPPSANGRAVVRIVNGPGDGVIRYAIDSLLVDGADSRLSGRFNADVSGDVAIRDLDLTLAPLDFALLHEVLGDSVPAAPWDGAVRGRLLARGGKLGAWHVDPSTLVFEDRRAGGARSRVTIAGTLDLLAKEVTFAPLDVTVDSLDVRTVGAVTAVADSLDGFLRGRVRLTGPLSDFRFADLDIFHTDGAFPRSHVRGEGRVALDTARTWLEARLALDTVSVAAIGKAFTPQALRGVLAGTLTTSARGDSVHLDAQLHGEGAQLSFAGATSLDTARLVLRGVASVEQFDAREFLRESTLPAHRVTARAVLGIDGGWADLAGPVSLTIDSTSMVAGLAIHEGRASLLLEPGGIRVDTLELAAPLGRLNARGRLSRDPALRDTLRFEAVIDSLALARGFLSDSLAEAWKDSLGGTIRLSGIAVGSLDTLDIGADFEAHGLRAGSSAADSVRGEARLSGVPRATQGLVSFEARNLLASGIPITRVDATALVRDATWADASVRMVAGDTLQVTARADVHWLTDSVRVRVDSLNAVTQTAEWSLVRPTELFLDRRYTVVDSLMLRSADGARFDLVARLDSAGPVVASIMASRVPLRHARFTGMVPEAVDGLVSMQANVTGTALAPLVHMTAALDSATYEGRSAPGLQFRGDYENRQADIDLRGRAADRDAFVLTGTLPLDLSFQTRTLDQRLIKDTLFVRFVADGTSLEGFEALVPGVRELRGGFDADILIGGRYDDLEPRGVFLLRDGSFSVPALGTGFREMDMDVSLAPDSVIFQHVRLADARSPNDTATVEGAIYRNAAGWHADLRTLARNLRVIDNPRVAEADVTWQLRLRGPIDSLVLGGSVFVPTANAYIAARRQVLALPDQLDRARNGNRYVPRIESLTIRLGNQVRLRSEEANVQLTGDIAVTGTLDSPDVRGEILATRGTYRLDLGLLQRTFQVDSGVVRMNGSLEDPPSLDIHTSYVVRQNERDDVRIGARLTGTTRQPRLTLSSGDLGTTATETEIISYLLFGAPSFALDGESSSAVRTATTALAPSLGGAVERALGGKLPFISELRVTTVASDDYTLNSFSGVVNSFEGILNRFALTAGKQVGTDSYVSLSAGVCRGESRAAQSLPGWFGLLAEYRPRERLSAQVSMTPGSNPCNRVGTFSQIYQFGLDLFRDWRW